MFTIRKVERKTVWQATEPVSLSPVHFSMLKSFPYTGEYTDEKSFLDYLWSLYSKSDYEQKERVFSELSDLGFSETSEAVQSLFDFEMEVYSDSSDDGEDSWLELGQINSSFYDRGGFEPKVSTGD